MQKHFEIGTSNGYSTLWLANAVEETNGNVTTVELSSERVGEALPILQIFYKGLMFTIKKQGILDSQPDHSFDFIFLDSERTQYMWWLEHIKRILQPKGLLVVDNATSHASELAEFINMIEEDEMFETVLLAFQNGAFVARKKK